MRRRLLLMGLLWGALAAPTRALEDPSHVLLRAESDDAAVASAANAELAQLDDAQRVAVLRAALAAEDRSLALAAARRILPATCDLGELRRASSLLVSDPGFVATPRSVSRALGGLGAPEVPAALDAFAAHPSPDLLDAMQEVHRALDESHVPVLVAHLADESSPSFDLAKWLLHVATLQSDAHRDAALRGWLYVLERLAWERAVSGLDAGAAVPPPPLAPHEVTLTPQALGPRPSPEFLRLARATWGDDATVWWGPTGARSPRPHYWLQRWAADLVPTAGDRDALRRLAREVEDEWGIAWALGRLAILDAEDSKGLAAWLAALHDEDPTSERGAMAAAYLARLGEPGRWRKLQALLTDDSADAWERGFARELATLSVFTWIADRDAARRQASADDLSRRARERLRLVWGIEIGLDDLRAVEARLWESSDAGALVRFYSESFQGGVTPSVAARLVEPLRGVSIRRGDMETEDGSVALRPLLALMELVARDALTELLTAWSERPEADARRLGYQLLARLGHGDDVDAMIASWREGWEEDAWALGRVALPAVESVLTERLTAARAWGASRDAVAALLVLAGLPHECADVAAYDYLDDDLRWSDEPLATVRGLLLDGKPREALAALMAAGDDPTLLLFAGLAGAPTERIEARRAARESGEYWPATLALALAGKAEARREIEGLLAENRTWVLDDLVNPGWLALAARREGSGWHMERLSDNCCARFQAVQVLQKTYPHMPIANDQDSPLNQLSFSRRWLDERAGRFRWSWIAEGWLAVPRP